VLSAECATDSLYLWRRNYKRAKSIVWEILWVSKPASVFADAMRGPDDHQMR